VARIASDHGAVEAPDHIVLERDRDLVGRGRDIWIRRSLFAVLPLFALLALLDIFGQRPDVTRAASTGAGLEVLAPSRIRSGVLYEARFTVEAHRAIHDAVLVLDQGWFEGMTVNSIAPSPRRESSANGKPALDLGPIAAGRSHVLYVYFQTNPTTVARRTQTTRLLDGMRLLLTVRRSITVFP
jgi:hypothetical protein